MSSWLRIIGYVLAGLCLAGVIVVGLAVWGVHKFQTDLRDVLRSSRNGAPISAAEVAQAERIGVLSQLDFDAGPVRLILEPSLTGGEALVVDDQSVLRDFAAQASIPNLGLDGRLTLIDVFFDRKGRMARVPALRIYQNGRLFSIDYCLDQLCQDDAETQASLAPLIAAASGRLLSHAESFTDYDAYAVAFQAAKSAPDLLTELPLHPSPRASAPISFTLDLPAFTIADRRPSEQMRQELSDYDMILGDAIEAKLGGGIGAYGVSNWVGGADHAVYDRCSDDKRPVTLLKGVTLITTKIEGDTDEAGYARLAAITDWSFLPLRPTVPLPEEIDRRLAAGELAPDCLYSPTTGSLPLLGPIELSPPQPAEYHLQWEEVVPLKEAG